MDKQQKIKIKLDILKTILEVTKPNFENNIIEIDINKLYNIIEKLEAQLEILQEN